MAAHNAAHDPDLIPDAGWVPTLRVRLDPTAAVPGIVNATAGAQARHLSPPSVLLGGSDSTGDGRGSAGS